MTATAQPLDGASGSPVREGFDVVPITGLLSASPLPVVVHDSLGRVVDANQAFADLLGYTLSDVLTKTAADLIHPGDMADRDRLARELFSGRQDMAVADRRLRRRGGDTLHARVYKSAVDTVEGRMVMVCVHDLDADRRRMDELIHSATHDELTGVLNRAGALHEMTTFLAAGRHGVLAVVDVNGLKLVNDRFGHAAGDAVLRTMARRMQDAVPESGLVGRIGGDEFVVVADGDVDLTDAVERALAAEFEVLPGLRMPLSASIGEVTLGPAADLDAVLRDADRLMYRQKRLRVP